MSARIRSEHGYLQEGGHWSWCSKHAQVFSDPVDLPPTVAVFDGPESSWTDKKYGTLVHNEERAPHYSYFETDHSTGRPKTEPVAVVVPTSILNWLFG